MPYASLEHIIHFRNLHARFLSTLGPGHAFTSRALGDSKAAAGCVKWRRFLVGRREKEDRDARREERRVREEIER